MKSYPIHTMKSYQWYEFIPFTMTTDNLLLGNIKLGKQVILNLYALLELFGPGL